MVILQWYILLLRVWCTCAWICSFVLVSFKCIFYIIKVQRSWYFIIAWLICLSSCKCWPYIRVQESWNTKPLYCACLFHALLLNASWQYMPLLNLHPLIFGLTPFHWLCSIITNSLFLIGKIFDSHLFLGNASRMWKKGFVYEFLSCVKFCLCTENGRKCCRSVRTWDGDQTRIWK